MFDTKTYQAIEAHHGGNMALRELMAERYEHFYYRATHVSFDVEDNMFTFDRPGLKEPLRMYQTELQQESAKDDYSRIWRIDRLTETVRFTHRDITLTVGREDVGI